MRALWLSVLVACGPARVGLEADVGFGGWERFLYRPNGGLDEITVRARGPRAVAVTALWPLHPRLELGLDGGMLAVDDPLNSRPTRWAGITHNARLDLRQPTGGPLDLHGRLGLGGLLVRNSDVSLIGLNQRVGVGLSHEAEGIRVGVHVDYHTTSAWPLAGLWTTVVLEEYQPRAFGGTLVGLGIDAPW